MPDVFNAYARYYDLLYKEKDYVAEAAYVHALIQKFKPDARSILNLGCGTGRHDACLAQLGYEVHGVDMSDTMLDAAQQRAIPGKLEFSKGDVRTLGLKRSFDVVISLFHVMSYQTSDEDLSAAFRTANRHLTADGIFIFDFWHGQGVLNDPPAVRVKNLEDEKIRVVRTAEPVMHKDRNVVDVHFQIKAFDKSDSQWSELKEKHSMRYFFLPEIKEHLLKAGFMVKEAYEWMSDRPLSAGWYGIVVAHKKGSLE